MASAKKLLYNKHFYNEDLLALLAIQLKSLNTFFAVKYLLLRV
jgi:hypothetical protein